MSLLASVTIVPALTEVKTDLTDPMDSLIYLQTTDDILVASAECPSDDEDIDPCETSSGGLG